VDVTSRSSTYFLQYNEERGTKKYMLSSSTSKELSRRFYTINSNLNDKLFYKKVSTKIKLDQGESDNIAITERLMQGCIASPLLFTLFISDIMEVIKNSGISGIDISDLYVLHMSLFADDMVQLLL
jgi:hypothetical protein